MRVSVIPLMSGLALAAGAVGLQLGHATVAQIDPLYFQGGAIPARDVSNDPRPHRRNAFADASGWDVGGADRAVDCGADCSPILLRQAEQSVPLADYSDPTIEPRWERAEAAAPEDMLPAERSAEAVAVRRYLDYPVTAEQAERRAAVETRQGAVDLAAADGV